MTPGGRLGVVGVICATILSASLAAQPQSAAHVEGSLALAITGALLLVGGLSAYYGRHRATNDHFEADGRDEHERGAPVDNVVREPSTDGESGNGTARDIASRHTHRALGPTPSSALPMIDKSVDDSRSPEAANQSKPATILIVEDDEAVRYVGARALRACGYTVFTARNGEIALRIVEERSGAIDVLMTDVARREHDGRALAGTIRERAPHLRVIFTSGDVDDQSVVPGVATDGAALLQKPYALDVLISTIIDTLARPAVPGISRHGTRPSSRDRDNA